MSSRYLLDTNIISDLVRHPRGRVKSKIADLHSGLVATSIIVAAELRFGAERMRAERLLSNLESILSRLEVLPFAPPDDRAYSAARVELEAAGTPIGGNDLLIAAQALARDMIMVTDNEREFRRIKRLRVENWLKGP